MKILLLCGKLSLTRVIRGLCSNKKNELHCFFESEGALDWLSRELPNFILVDIRMLNGKGIAFIKKVKKKKSDIKIIGMSGYKSDRKRSIQIGCNGFVTYSFLMEELKKEALWS